MPVARTISRRTLLALGAGLGLGAALRSAHASGPVDVVVELFSSQACSSCAAVDALLAELRAMPGVLTLSFHVDYWDYLGWKDTLASPDFSQRQYGYAKARGDMEVFTPQVIVNGGHQLPGHQREAVLAAIAEARKARWTVPLTISDDGPDLSFAVGASTPAEKATLWVMPIQERATAVIEKGELAGREISYSNIVRRLVPAGAWHGEAARFTLPKESLLTGDARSCVALLQRGNLGPVLSCAGWGHIVS